MAHDSTTRWLALSERLEGTGRWLAPLGLRLLLAWQTFTPGKKLSFMGNEFGQRREWSEARELDWGLATEPGHAGVQRLSADLNAPHPTPPPNSPEQKTRKL